MVQNDSIKNLKDSFWVLTLESFMLVLRHPSGLCCSWQIVHFRSFRNFFFARWRVTSGCNSDPV